MLHTKLHGNRDAGSGENCFKGFYHIYWHGGHLSHVSQMLRTNFRSPFSRRLHIKFGFDRLSSEKKML